MIVGQISLCVHILYLGLQAFTFLVEDTSQPCLDKKDFGQTAGQILHLGKTAS